MKKLILILAITTLIGCSSDDDFNVNEVECFQCHIEDFRGWKVLKDQLECGNITEITWWMRNKLKEYNKNSKAICKSTKDGRELIELKENQR